MKKVCCILGHRYGEPLISALLEQPDVSEGRVSIVHAFMLHPSRIWATAGYSFAKSALLRAGIEHSYFSSLDQESIWTRLRALEPDYVLVCGLRKIISAELLRGMDETLDEEDASDFRPTFIAFHPSDLPHGAGLSPIQWALLEEDQKLTVSAFLLGDYPIDGGPIVAKQSVPLGDVDAREADRLAGECIARIITSLVPQLVAGMLSAAPQTPDRPATRRQLGATDRWLDFTEPAEKVLRRIRAFSPPYGGCFCELRNQIVWIGAAVLDHSASLPPGSTSPQGPAVVVGCADGNIRLLEWRRADTGAHNLLE